MLERLFSTHAPNENLPASIFPFNSKTPGWVPIRTDKGVAGFYFLRKEDVDVPCVVRERPKIPGTREHLVCFELFGKPEQSEINCNGAPSFSDMRKMTDVEIKKTLAAIAAKVRIFQTVQETEPDSHHHPSAVAAVKPALLRTELMLPIIKNTLIGNGSTSPVDPSVTRYEPLIVSEALDRAITYAAIFGLPDSLLPALRV